MATLPPPLRTFQAYLDDVKLTFSTGGDHRNDLFNVTLVLPPTDQELTNFLGLLDGIVGTETKKLGGAKDASLVTGRRNAIALLLDFALKGPLTGAFAKISRNTLCFQLALRVRRPKVIDQSLTTLCGPVALVVDVAKRDPVRYVRTAIDLFQKGHAAWGSFELAPGLLVRNGFNKQTPEADYVVLASIRDTAAIIIGEPTLRNIFTLTKPGALCKFLGDAGYCRIIDRTFLALSPALKTLNAITPHPLFDQNYLPLDKGIASLQKAQEEMGMGRTVIMNAASRLSNIVLGYAPANPAPGPIDAGETHWTLLRKLNVQPAPGNVTVRLVTWGGSGDATMPTAVFLSYYCGYVSGDPC